ncbi:MAG: hypothetical protein Q4A43_03560 [Coriobacteriia bacterium]|nr:hypothetical protein [Coriobacteriia bacterium]
MEISGLKTVRGLGTAIVVLAILGIVVSAICILASDFLAQNIMQSSQSDYESALSAVGLTVQDVGSLPEVEDQLESNKLSIITSCVVSIIFGVLLLIAGLKARKVTVTPDFATVKTARNWGIAAIVFSVLGSDLITLILSIILVVMANRAKGQLATVPAPVNPAA